MDNKKGIKKYEKIFFQFIKYIFVGGVAFLFDFSFLYFLTEFIGMHYLISATLSFVVGLNVNYFLAKYFVFKHSKIKNIKAEYIFIIFISLSGLLLNNGLLWILTELFGIFYLISKIISTFVILFYNFTVRKLFIFE